MEEMYEQLKEEYYQWAMNEMMNNKIPTWQEVANWWISKISKLINE